MATSLEMELSNSLSIASRKKKECKHGIGLVNNSLGNPKGSHFNNEDSTLCQHPGLSWACRAGSAITPGIDSQASVASNNH